MSGSQENNKRIAKNTALLYFRMLVMLFVTFYTSRVTLNVLGVTDFGIYNIVAGFILMLGFFQSSLANATQRYISAALGKNDLQLAERAFRQSFTLLLIFSVIVIIVGETLGLWFVQNKLVIPDDRSEAAFWVYQASLLSVFFSVNQVPLMSAIVSREKMSFYAYLGLFEAFAKLGVTFFLLYTSHDRLIVYGFLLALVSFITYIIYVIYCCHKFVECQLKCYWEKKLVAEMSKFVGYNLFGCFAYQASEQGTSILLNVLFGPVVNAARGISMQVSSAVFKFNTNIMTAFQPQMTKAYVSGDVAYLIFLIEKCSKFSFFLAAILIFPIIANVHGILYLWLGSVPEYSSRFTIYILLQTLFNILKDPLWLGANATGVIKYNQVYGRIITLASIPISYFLLLFYPIADLPLIVLVVTQFGYWLYSIYDMKRQINLKYLLYSKKVVMPCFILSLLLCVLIALFKSFYEADTLFSIITSLSIEVFMGVFFSYLLLERQEKEYVWSYAKKHLPFLKR